MASEPITAAPIIAHIVRSRCSEARVGHLRRRAALEFVVVGGALPGGGMRRGCSGMRVVFVVVFVVLFVVVVGVLMSLLLLLLALLDTPINLPNVLRSSMAAAERRSPPYAP